MQTKFGNLVITALLYLSLNIVNPGMSRPSRNAETLGSPSKFDNYHHLGKRAFGVIQLGSSSERLKGANTDSHMENVRQDPRQQQAGPVHHKTALTSHKKPNFKSPKSDQQVQNEESTEIKDTVEKHSKNNIKSPDRSNLKGFKGDHLIRNDGSSKVDNYSQNQLKTLLKIKDKVHSKIHKDDQPISNEDSADVEDYKKNYPKQSPSQSDFKTLVKELKALMESDEAELIADKDGKNTKRQDGLQRNVGIERRNSLSATAVRNQGMLEETRGKRNMGSNKVTLAEKEANMAHVLDPVANVKGLVEKYNRKRN